MISSDNQVRAEGGDMVMIDTENRNTMISILENCGWVEEKTKQIWWLNHHNMGKYIPFYYPKLKKRVGQYNLTDANLAYMEDRMLMNSGFPQIYGTQIDIGHIYPIFDPENVNERRRKVGIRISENEIKTIEMESKNWGLNWKDELKRMKDLEHSFAVFEKQ